MLECKLWNSKAVTKTVKGAKVMGFIKTCDQYHHKCNFGPGFSSFIVSLPPFCCREIDFRKMLPGVDDNSLEERFARETCVKMNRYNFFNSKMHFLVM